MSNAPIGFEPRSALRPAMWLHTIELNSDRALAGAVVVVSKGVFPDVPTMLTFITGEAKLSAVLHQTGEEIWVRLDRNQAIALRERLGGLTESTSPFGDDQYDAYRNLDDIDAIVDNEDD